MIACRVEKVLMEAAVVHLHMNFFVGSNHPFGESQVDFIPRLPRNETSEGPVDSVGADCLLLGEDFLRVRAQRASDPFEFFSVKLDNVGRDVRFHWFVLLRLRKRVAAPDTDLWREYGNNARMLLSHLPI